MNSKLKHKLGIDFLMTVLLMLLMSYELIGQRAHEWIGVAMFVLFLVHHILNRKWFGNLRNGRWSPVRIWQVLLILWVLASMLGSMVSGIILSRSVFTFLPIRQGQGISRTVHQFCAYWGFAGMSLHLGFYWNMILTMAKKHANLDSAKWSLRILAAVIVFYGIYAFLKRDIGSYMLLQNEFVFFDYEEPLLFFFMDYLAVMGMFVCLGHYMKKILIRLSQKHV